MAYNNRAMYRWTPHIFGKLFSGKSGSTFIKGSIVVFFLLSACLPLQSASAITLKDLSGASYTYDEISDLPQVVIMVWTSWCYSCRKKLVSFNCIALDSSPVQFFFVNAGEKASTVTAFIRKQGISSCITEKILLDRTAAISRQFRLPGVPAFIFIKNGKVVHLSYSLNDSIIKDVFND